MLREKIIITALVLTAIMVLMDTISFMSLGGNSMMDKTKISQTLIEDPIPANLSIKTPPRLMKISDWKEDIFHDRSHIYDSWFELTGITRFEDEFKAIINGEIVKESDQIRGFKLKSITKNLVVLKRHQYRVTLKLEE